MSFAQDIIGLSDESVVWSKNHAYFGHVWDGTVDPIKKVASTLHRACFHDTGLNGIVIDHACGVGVSSMLAWLGMWFAQVFSNAKVFTVAPLEAQLRAQVWHYAEQYFPAFNESPWGRNATFSKEHLRLNVGKSSIEGAALNSTTSPFYGRGVFADHMLFLVDNAHGVSAEVLHAIRNMCTGRKNFIIAAGAPQTHKDPYRLLASEAGFEHVRISALDHPNVVTGKDIVPGAANRRFVRRMLDEYGDPLNPVFLARVRGIAPPDAVVPGFIKGDA